MVFECTLILSYANIKSSVRILIYICVCLHVGMLPLLALESLGLQHMKDLSY